MSTQAKLVAINLKHLYQRRGCWLYYLYILIPIMGSFVGIMELSFEGGVHLDYNLPNAFISMLFLAFFANMLAAKVVGDTLRFVVGCPISVCLPGFSEVPAKIIAVIGLLVNLGYVGILVATTGQFFYALVFIFAFGIFAYINFTAAMLMCFNAAGLLLSFGFILISWFIAGTCEPAGFWRFFEMHSLWISAIVLVMCWRQLKNIDARRITEKLCGGLDESAVREDEKQNRCHDNFMAGDFWEKLMNLSRSQSVKYAIGFAMARTGHILNKWRIVHVMCLCYVLFACYTNLAPLLFMYIFGFSTSINMTAILGCGRMERLKGALLGSLIYTVIVTMCCFLIILASVVFGTFMPSISLPWIKEVIVFEPLEFRYAAVIFFSAPAIVISEIWSQTGPLFPLVFLFMMLKIIFGGDISLILPTLLLYAACYLLVFRYLLKADLKFAR